MEGPIAGPSHSIVIPANTGIHGAAGVCRQMDPGLRRGDSWWMGHNVTLGVVERCLIQMGEPTRDTAQAP